MPTSSTPQRCSSSTPGGASATSPPRWLTTPRRARPTSPRARWPRGVRGSPRSPGSSVTDTGRPASGRHASRDWPADGMLAWAGRSRSVLAEEGTGMLAQAHVAALAGRHLPAGLVVAGSVLMAAATVEGAWLALRRPGRHGAWLGAASGALLVIALLHLLPDAGSAARAAGIWPLAVPARGARVVRAGRARRAPGLRV